MNKPTESATEREKKKKTQRTEKKKHSVKVNAPWAKWVLLIVQSGESPIIFVVLSFVLVAVFF